MYRLADRFDVAESSVQTCVDKILAFLNVLSAEVIAWLNAKKGRCKAGFVSRSDGKVLRNTIGCIEGCHIEINTPSESAPSYSNRKTFPSIILRGLCDNRNSFIDLLVGFQGSAHDARLLKEGPFLTDAGSNCGGGYLMGDSDDPLLPWRMTPYRKCENTFPTWKK
ncbi:hypothetical protein HPB49_010622 [Dermacentor silvarum]|uniref:Uncharacterized protein n=1 Tax=Dermacentor silvarum TaxID=543639 RepID=A0ACB8D4C4_DERSI|nr:hypothetical protein HPB49_010622 [Dermacentor silvarum]